MLTHAPTMKFLRWALCLLLLCCSSLPVLAQSPDGGVSAIDRDALATDAYRNGDFKNLSTARVLWSDELADPSLADEAGKRARLCYNLGTLCLREGKNMEAVAWFSAALRLRPRDADTWANLEVARLNAGLDVADRGDLKASVEQLLNSLTKQESSLLALFGLLPLALALAYEALRGGRRARALTFFSLVIWILALAPWVRQSWTTGAQDLIVIADNGSTGRSEPRLDASRVEKLEQGSVWTLVDQLPGWSEVQLNSRRRVWLRSQDVFKLSR